MVTHNKRRERRKERIVYGSGDRKERGRRGNRGEVHVVVDQEQANWKVWVERIMRPLTILAAPTKEWLLLPTGITVIVGILAPTVVQTLRSLRKNTADAVWNFEPL